MPNGYDWIEEPSSSTSTSGTSASSSSSSSSLQLPSTLKTMNLYLAKLLTLNQKLLSDFDETPREKKTVENDRFVIFQYPSYDYAEKPNDIEARANLYALSPGSDTLRLIAEFPKVSDARELARRFNGREF